MNKPNHTSLVTIISMVSVLFVGCSGASNATTKTDTKSGSVSISNTDIDFKSSDNLEWPEAKMAPLPKPDAKITALTESIAEKVTVVHIGFDQPGLVRDYIQKVKALGYKEITMTDRDGTIEFTGYMKDNTEVNINYLDMANAGFISMKKDSMAAKDYYK